MGFNVHGSIVLIMVLATERFCMKCFQLAKDKAVPRYLLIAYKLSYSNNSKIMVRLTEQLFNNEERLPINE
jgi:hypothetical protein